MSENFGKFCKLRKNVVKCLSQLRGCKISYRIRNCRCKVGNCRCSDGNCRCCVRKLLGIVKCRKMSLSTVRGPKWGQRKMRACFIMAHKIFSSYHHISTTHCLLLRQKLGNLVASGRSMADLRRSYKHY